MTTNQQMFIYAAEELSFTRAAERAFVTQQCLSDHIKRLEQSYQTRLFIRSPKLSLTPAGELLYRSLLEIRNIENNVQQSISEGSRDVVATINVGIHAERAHLLIPHLFPEYHALYPNVRLSLISDQTPNLIRQLKDGALDLVIGLDTPADRELVKDPILEEPVYLFATARLLRKYLPSWTPERTEIYPEELSLLPLSCTSYICAVTSHMGHFLTERNIPVNYICAFGDYSTQLELTRQHNSAFFCPESFLMEEAFFSSCKGDPETRVRPLSISGLASHIRVEIVHSIHGYIPKYTATFEKLLKNQYQARMRDLRTKELPRTSLTR